MRLLLIPFLVACVGAVPSIYFPINSQVPPVARASQAFEYQFAASTFAPLTESFTYTITNAPAWLSLDGNSRTLYGTPGLNDVGAANFNLTALDSEGSMNMPVILVVVSQRPPQLSMSISDQLAQAGRLTGPRSLSLYPSTAFTLNFSSTTFVSEWNLSYYATLSNHTPLPSWLNFDPGRLEFYGTAPELTASPQFFEVLLIAADVVGFAGAWASFVLVLTWHQLYFDPWERQIDFDDGRPINFGALETLMFDGNRYNDSILDRVTASLPQWLALDQSSYNISGTPPPSTAIQDINITVTDIFGDTATGLVHLQRRSTLILGEIGTLNATIGEEFNYTIPTSVIAQGDYNVSVDFGSASSWFTFDATTLNIQGYVPVDVKPRTVIASLVVSSSASDTTQSEMFSIRLEESQMHSSSTATIATRSSPSNTSSSSATTRASSSENGGIAKGTIVVVAIVIAIVVFVLALLLFWWCMRRKRRRWEGAAFDPSRREISRPVMEAEPGADVEKNPQQALHTPERPPRLDVELPDPNPVAQSRYRRSVTTSLEDGDAATLVDFNRSSWGFRPHIHAPHDAMKVPAELARLSRVSETSPLRRYPRRSVRRSNGVPFNRRLTGVGHGRSPYGSSAREQGSISTRNPYDCNSCGSYSTQSTGMLSATPSAFPVPTSLREGRAVQTTTSQAVKRKSIRLVNSGSVLDQRPLSERRQSYIRNRVMSKSPFFGGAASRTSSQSKRIMSGTDFTEHSISPSRRRKAPSRRTTLPTLSSIESPLQLRTRSDRPLRMRIAEGFPRVTSIGTRSSLRDSEQFESASNSSWYSDDEELIVQSHDESDNANSPQRDNNGGRRVPERGRPSWEQLAVKPGAKAQTRRLRLRESRVPLSIVSNDFQRLGPVGEKGERPLSVSRGDFWQQQVESAGEPDDGENTWWPDGSVRGNAAFL